MDQASDKWARTVFRLRLLPHSVNTLDSVARLLQEKLAVDSIHVFSLASMLNSKKSPPFKVATLMFSAIPSILVENSSAEEWSIPHGDPHKNEHLILDINFIGITPLNDVSAEEHLSDCISISGLASHPFGSWQPKGGDKKFMWVRDSLPEYLPCTRVVLYGYDTKLHDSHSFQTISDLANTLIHQLQAYGWGSLWKKPVAFLAHSLGGLVLRDALVQLSQSSDEAYKCLLSIVHGAVFFGVPNLGMEQSHLRTIVQGKPNEVLVEDLARNSHYLRQLDEDFEKASIDQRVRCFWAYETAMSPTVSRASDGNITRNGRSAVLVSRESATCRRVEKDKSTTFSINATHSEMVKFKKGSQYLDVVASKLKSILPSQHQVGDHSPDNPGVKAPQATLAAKDPFAAELDKFDRTLGLTEAEHKDLASTTFQGVQEVIAEIQRQQGEAGKMMHMKRLESFLKSMQQFSESAEEVKLSPDLPQAMAYVWGPMKRILIITSTVPGALNSVLDAYQEIGEHIPSIRDPRSLLASYPHLRNVLILIFHDILWFHRETMSQLKHQAWEQLFEASWADFAPTIRHIKQNIEQSKGVIESPVPLAQLSEIQNLRWKRLHYLEKDRRDEDASRRARVLQWLSPFDWKTVQNQHRNKRSIFCKNPGRWLMNDTRFQDWFKPGYCPAPMLWMSGKPGAGKTILTSVIIDKALRDVADATVIFFYCKHRQESRDSFLGVARSILAQILVQRPYLMPYFHEKASMSSDVSLTSSEIAKEMIQTTLPNCQNIYLIIDGLDECLRNERVEIASFFRATVENMTDASKTSDIIRCLFVSQDDGIARESFRHLPTIKIDDGNREDLQDFAQEYQRRIEDKFGELQSKKYHIAHIIAAQSQGMFIFAELFSKWLEDQVSRAALLKELDPAKLPVKLDQVYDRILDRVLESRGDHILNPLRRVLGWIVCARRPLRWREIQAAVSIDLTTGTVNYDKELSYSPKSLFASLVELQADGTVELVHRTVSEYLERKDHINIQEGHYSLAMLSVTYLSLAHFEKQHSDSEIESDLVSGVYAFYDYASACWAMHLQQLEPHRLSDLRETLEVFIELHWVPTYKPLPDLKRIEKSLSSIQNCDQFNKILQAVGWAKRQTGRHGLGPNPDEALDLWQVTVRIRSTLERISSEGSNSKELQRFYGQNLFKCPHVNCQYYHQGFPTSKQRNDHVNRHNRPFLCFIPGCHMGVFGHASKDELRNHLWEYHGMDVSEGADEAEYPDPPTEKTPSTAKAPATFQCQLCDKKFTRKANLESHTRTHQDDKPFSCGNCGQRFTRKTDCNRHEKGHGDKRFKCFGLLKDGKPWGCELSVNRGDKLKDHFRSKKGRECIRPMMLEKLQSAGDNGGLDWEGNVFAGQVGENADVLLAAGKSLPPFAEFLKLCGIDVKSALQLGSEAARTAGFSTPEAQQGTSSGSGT